MPFTGFLHLAHVSYLSQRLHVDGTCLREHLANLLTSRLEQNDMNSINLQYIKLNNAKTYEQTPAMLKTNIRAIQTQRFTVTLSLLQPYAYVHQAFVRFLFW